MGRKRKTNGVRDAFVYNGDDDTSTCSVCEKRINGNHHGNLSHHLEKHHPDVLKSLSETQNAPVEPPQKKIKITLEYKPNEVLDAWCNLVIREGRPFVLLDSEYLRFIIQPIFDALELNMITSHNIGAEIKLRTDAMVEDVKEVCAHRMLSLKIDSASRHRRRVMCVNAQFTHHTKLIVITLAMRELNGPHSGENVRNYVLEVLQRYNIELEQIYSCTQDNGKNLILAANLLQFHGYNEEDANENEIEGDNLVPDYEVESESDEEECDDEPLDSFNFMELYGVQVIRCAAHILALIVDDTMKKLNIKQKIARIRKLVKLLRTPTFVDKIKSEKSKLKLPKLDNKTRWNSKYDMISSFIPLKKFCEKNVPTKDSISESDWTFCETFLEVFQPVKIATKSLQSEQLTLGDFFKIWLKLTLQVKEQTKTSKSLPLAVELYKILMTREKMFFENNKCLLAALYLDPRFRNILTKLRPDQFDLREAQEHLLSLYKQIKKVEYIPPPEPEVARPLEDDEVNIDQILDDEVSPRNPAQEELPLRLRLRSMSRDVPVHTPSTSTSQLLPPTSSSVPRASSSQMNCDNVSLDDFINDLFEENPEPNRPVGDDDVVAAFGVICNYKDRKPLETNVLEYWYSKRFSNPILYKLATVVHAVPATQVSVERCFSVLKFILSDYRSSMREDTLENLMLLRLNAGLKSKLQS